MAIAGEHKLDCVLPYTQYSTLSDAIIARENLKIFLDGWMNLQIACLSMGGTG